LNSLCEAVVVRCWLYASHSTACAIFLYSILSTVHHVHPTGRSCLLDCRFMTEPGCCLFCRITHGDPRFDCLVEVTSVTCWLQASSRAVDSFCLFGPTAWCCNVMFVSVSTESNCWACTNHVNMILQKCGFIAWQGHTTAALDSALLSDRSVQPDLCLHSASGFPTLRLHVRRFVSATC
jgi:hypothetical protein